MQELSDQSATRTLTLDYVKTIGIINNNPVGRGFAHPVDLAVNREGHIFVLNRHPGLARVGVCTLDERYLNEFGSYGHEDGQLWLPTSVALDSRGRVYVSDEFHHNVSVFDSSGEFLSQLGEPRQRRRPARRSVRHCGRRRGRPVRRRPEQQPGPEIHVRRGLPGPVG